jgi:chromate transporter
MARSLCPDRIRASIAAAAIFVVLAAPGSLGQVGAIVLGGLAGLALCRGEAGMAPSPLAMPVSRRAAAGFLAAFFVLLALSLVPGQAGIVGLASAFYRSGALVFGGGHVVLPLLRDAVVAPGWVSDNAFLTGYGAAQAVPGPLFTFSAYLGTVASGLGGAVVALVAIFVPGMLALLGTLPFWHGLRTRPDAQAAMRGINAAVVGILGSALYNPVWTSAVLTPLDFAIAVAGFVLLVAWRASPLVVVALSALAGAAVAMAHM